MGDVLEKRATELLEIGAPYDEESDLDMLDANRFEVGPSIVLDDTFRILDRARCISMNIPRHHLEDPEFNLIKWYGTELLKIDLQEFQAILSRTGHEGRASLGNLDLASIEEDRDKYPCLQRNTALVKRDTRISPKPIVLQVEINGYPLRVLVDNESLGNR